MNGPKSNATRWILALSGVLLVAWGCSKTAMTHSWMDSNFKIKEIRKVMVIGVGKEESMRRLFENRMSAILEKKRVPAVPSHTIMPDLRTAAGDEATARQIIGEAVAKCGADAVTITRILRSESAVRAVPGTAYVVPAGYYRGFYGFYTTSFEVVSTPGYITEDKTYVVETNLYDVATESLIWMGISETLNPDSAVDGIDSVGETIAYQLRKEGLIPR